MRLSEWTLAGSTAFFLAAGLMLAQSANQSKIQERVTRKRFTQGRQDMARGAHSVMAQMRKEQLVDAT